MYEQLSFPLNVYAKILELNNAPVNSLHFGLFEKADDDIYQAQQRLTEKILKFFPPPPASILEIGIGLGTTQKILLDKGYSAEGLTPDPAQIDIARNRIGAFAKLYCSKFEDFKTSAFYDAVLTQESAQYLDLLNLIPKANQLLKQDGYFILIDQVSLKRNKQELISLHQPEHIKFIAKCCGFHLIHEEALGEQTKYTMDYLLKGLNNHWQEILSRIEQDNNKLTELKITIEDYINKYERGDYGYQFLIFQKSKKSESNSINGLSYLGESHFSAFQLLFKDAFSSSMSKTLWNWKYNQNTSFSLGLWEDDKLVGHYGGFPREVLLFGKKAMAIQVGDTMVASHKRAVFTKNGIFHQLARSFLYRFIGYGTPYLIGFGFPTTRVMKLAVKLGLYYNAGKFTRLVWDVPQRSHASLLYKIRPVSTNDKDCIDKLWLAMSKQCKKFIIGKRNWQHINYRYLQSPLHQYHVLKINNRLTNQLIAIIVLRIQEHECMIVDFISKMKHIPLVVDSALRFAYQERKKDLSVLISDNLRFLFSKRQYTETDPEISIPHCACTNGPDLIQIKDKWWLIAGDSDCM